MATAKKKAGFSKKLGNFLRNPKGLVLLVFILGFVGFGTYKLYVSHADTKAPNSVGQCRDASNAGGYYEKQGSNDDCVKTIKRTLNDVGSVVQAGWPFLDPYDSYFDATTAQAVRGFQGWAGISQDGIVGPDTYGKLLDACINVAHQGGGICY